MKTRTRKTTSEPRTKILTLGPIKRGDRVIVHRLNNAQDIQAKIVGTVHEALDGALMIEFKNRPRFPVTVEPTEREPEGSYWLTLRRANWYAIDNDKLEFTVEPVKPT